MPGQPEKGPWFVQKTQGVWTVYQSAMNEFHATRELAQQRADELNAAKRVRDAAPQLLAACKAIQMSDRLSIPAYNRAMKLIDAAIAATEGTG